MVRRSIFDQIFREMQSIRIRLDDLENSIANWNPQPLEVSESRLISLPDHLRRTYLVVVSKGECTAIDVSNATGRCRAIESNYLNQLARMGWLNKRRISKTTHFRGVPNQMLKKNPNTRLNAITIAESSIDLKETCKK
ncbi:MAG: helix-turn-helix domain-containing protein [Candidatus Bathyarchaeota archaeon]|nr:helix-turn-helix domain-containing protein [Candidatus Bathyarchaeota archaeon]